MPGSPLQDAAIWTYNVDSWEPQFKLAEYWNILDIAFSPDGSTAAAGLCEESDGPGQCVRGAVWLRSLSSRKLIETLSDLASAVQVEISDMALSADGRLLATGGPGGFDLWSVCGWRPSFPRASPQVAAQQLGGAPAAYALQTDDCYASLPGVE